MEMLKPLRISGRLKFHIPTIDTYRSERVEVDASRVLLSSGSTIFLDPRYFYSRIGCKNFIDSPYTEDVNIYITTSPTNKKLNLKYVVVGLDTLQPAHIEDKAVVILPY